VSGDNHCRAHLSESEDLGSVAKSEVKFELPIFQGRRFRDKDERVKAVLRDVFLEGSEKYPKGGLSSEEDNCVVFGRITKTDLGTDGTQRLSSYT
jgi:hypothetical protein